MRDAVLILGFDEALAGLITRTLRSQQIYCEPVPSAITLAQVTARAPRGLILAAGESTKVDPAAFDLSVLHAGLPVLALGATVAMLCEHFGGTVEPPEGGNENVTLDLADVPLFEGMTRGERVLHGLRDLRLPEGLTSLATATERCIGFQLSGAPLYAVQYPIERNDPDAILLLRNFACLVCDIQPFWTEDLIIQQAVETLRDAASEGRVLCAISGGVDSAVCARLASMAVGNRLMCVFVDTGLFRQDEPQTVIESYMDTLGLVVAYVDARETFLKALQGVRFAADKERIASSLLRQVIFKQLGYDSDIHTLVLGTNYNDTLYGQLSVEPLPEVIGAGSLRVMEPVRLLFKDEVRRLGKALSLPSSIVERQPFPASGLALRILGEVTDERLTILRQADAFFSEEIHAGGHERKLWQYYASMSENPDESNGYAVILRACQACSGEACASRLPYDLLERVMERILHELPDITRVLYDLTPSQHYSLME